MYIKIWFYVTNVFLIFWTSEKFIVSPQNTKIYTCPRICGYEHFIWGEPLDSPALDSPVDCKLVYSISESCDILASMYLYSYSFHPGVYWLVRRLGMPFLEIQLFLFWLTLCSLNIYTDLSVQHTSILTPGCFICFFLI